MIKVIVYFYFKSDYSGFLNQGKKQKYLLYGFRISLPTWNVWQKDEAGHQRSEHVAVLYEQVAQELRDDLPL